MKEGEMVGWHHRLNGHEFEQALRDCETVNPGLLQNTGSQRVGQDQATEQEQHAIIYSSLTSIMMC